ncbi:ribonuclease H-like domain-containing protein [Tanacetum coccineum]
MLKLGEYEMWEIRIKQYFQIQDYALWEVIENGNSWVPIPVTTPESGPSTALKMTVPSTTEEKICKKNDVKARSLLLMALPNEHQLTFNQYVDAQSMFVAIKARFGGNDATKKTQKALLKQQYENFNATSSESLDSIFNRLQKLVSRLAILGVDTPPEDLNVKFLRSLPSEWDTHVVVWMNKPDFETMGLDDLYNNFKIVEQKVKRTATANNVDKNLAFLTTSSSSSTNTINIVNTGVSTGNTKVNTASTETSTASFSDATIYAFLSTQPQGSQLVHEDLEQLYDDDLEEMDLKWNMTLLSMRARKFYQRTGRKIIIDGSSTAGYDKSKVECFNCHKMGHFARECRAPRSKDNINWNQGSLLKAVRIEDASEKAMCAIDGAGFNWSDMEEDEIQANMALMTFTDSEDQPPLELYCQVCEEFKTNEVNGVEEPKKARENTDAPIIEDWVSDDEEEVESIPKEEKKVDVPIATKKESVKTVNPSRRQTVNTVRPNVNTVRIQVMDAQGTCLETSLQSFRFHKVLLEVMLLLVEEQMEEESLVKEVLMGQNLKNHVDVMEFCREKGIKREYSVARTPQQNGVAERKNKTLIEGIKPAIGFMKPFGCHVTILNTLDKLGKFDGKSDEGFFVGYSLSSKAFRVYKEFLSPAHPLNKIKIDNGIDDQQVNTASPQVNNGSREVSTAVPEVNTATSEGLMGPIPTTEDTQVEDQEIELGNISPSYGRFLGALYEERSQDLNTCLFACFLSQEEPKRVSKALSDPAWVEAMQEELLQFKLQNVWVLVDLPKVIGLLVQSGSNKERKAYLLVLDNMSIVNSEEVSTTQIYHDWSLMFLTASRPDIMVAVSCMCKLPLLTTGAEYVLLQVAVESAEALTDGNGDVKINATVDGHSLICHHEGSLRRVVQELSD